MKDIDTLVQDIYDRIVASDEEPDDISDYLSNIGFNYRRAMTRGEDRDRKPEILYFSEIGTPCKRKLWYRINNAGKDSLPAHARIKFMYGDILEELVLQLSRDAGHVVQDEQKEVEYVHPSGWRVRGRIDAIVDDVLVDVKSVSKFGKQKFENNLVDDPFGYKDQLNGYGSVLKNKRMGFITIEKELGHIAYHDFGTPDPVKFEKLVTEAVEVVTKDESPFRPYESVPQSKTSKNKKLCTECSYCEYKHICWADANGGDGLRGFIYSSKVEWLTDVVDLPRVPEIKEEEFYDE